MSRNAPPPLLPILFGKPQTFAMPTAEPTDARIKPHRLAKCLVCLVFFMLLCPAKSRFPFLFLGAENGQARSPAASALYISYIVKRLRAKVKENVFLCKIVEKCLK